MKSRKILLLALFLPLTAFAGISKQARFTCKVGAFDANSVNLNCVGSGGKYARTPRGWLNKGTNLRQGAIIEMTLSEKRFAEWSSINARGMANVK